MKVMNDYILVEKINETQTASGLYVPESAHVKHRIGIVYMDSRSHKSGEKILFLSRFGFDEERSEIELCGKKLLVLKEEQVIVGEL